jgi:hypothetical protein
MPPLSPDDAPIWTDDGTLGWSPERELAFVPQAVAPRVGPWSPVSEAVEADTADATLYWPWRLSIGLAQGFAFYWLFHSRSIGQWPGGDAFLFDAIALPLLFMPWAVMAGLGTIPLPRLAASAAVFTAILAALGWYHRWRIFGAGHSQPGISMLALSALALAIAQIFLDAMRGWRIAYADLFRAGWTLAARLLMLLLAVGTGLLLVHTPLLPRLTLESGDIIAMPFLGLCGALAFQLTAALPRFTAALTRALLATATIALPLAVAAAILVLSTALANGPPALVFLLALMSGLVIAISAAHRDGDEALPAWREGFAWFGAFLLLALAAMAVWGLQARVAALGWTSQRLFAAAAVALLGAYGIGYSAAAVIGLLRGRGLKGFEAVNIILGVVTLLGALALASPLADPLRLAAGAQAARLEQGQVAVAQFDFANLPRDGARFGVTALASLSHSLYPDIAGAAQLVRGAVADHLNPSEIGANIAVRTRGARLPATLLARDWTRVSGIPPCLTTATETCDAFFLDLNTDGRQEILLASGGETRWWGAVMEEDGSGRWRMAGKLAAGCGATLSDLRAGRFSSLPALPGWSDLAVGGQRLSVTPSGTGCSHY